jgi:valyl-tRNA synthetase
MPFLTEELWQRLVAVLDIPSHPASISLCDYPQALAAPIAGDAPFILFQNIVNQAREERAKMSVPPKITLEADLVVRDYRFSEDDLAILRQLSKLDLRQTESNGLGDSFELIISTPLGV